MSPQDIDNHISDKIGFLIERNANFVNVSRGQAQDMLQAAVAYRAMADICEEVAEMHALGALRIANLTGDLLTSEWVITTTDDEGDDVDETSGV